ncbi:MAG: hypothetical protein R6V73_01290 [Anaerolineales bacterium]
MTEQLISQHIRIFLFEFRRKSMKRTRLINPLQIIIAITLITCLAVPATAFGQTMMNSLGSFWTEDFNTPIQTEKYFIQGSPGSAYVDENSFLLTEDWSSQYGKIFFLEQAYMNDFQADFDLYLGNKEDGSDGLAFHFCPVYDYPSSDGGSLNANCPGGYLVAFDTHKDWTPGVNQVYVAKDGVENRLIMVEIAPLDDDTWRHWQVSTVNGKITVTQDSTVLINEFEIPGYTPFIGFFGFSAATGGGHNRQRVDNIVILSNPIYRNYLSFLISN